MNTRTFGSMLAVALIAGSAACSDVSPTAPVSAQAKARRDTDPVTTVQYRDYECYYERGGDLWKTVEHWQRDVTTYPDNSVVYGDPYFVSSEEIDTGPTAGVGTMWCETYDGTNW